MLAVALVKLKSSTAVLPVRFSISEKFTMSPAVTVMATVPEPAPLINQSLACVRPVKLSATATLVLPTKVCILVKAPPFTVPWLASVNTQVLSILVLVRFKVFVPPLPPEIVPEIVSPSPRVKVSLSLPPVSFSMLLKLTRSTKDPSNETVPASLPFTCQSLT